MQCQLHPTDLTICNSFNTSIMWTGWIWVAIFFCQRCKGFNVGKLKPETTEAEENRNPYDDEKMPYSRALRAADAVCKFSLMNTGNVDTCNYTVDMTQYYVYSWEFNVGINSYWLGGPPKDADDTVSGGFALMDMSVFTDRPKDGYQKRGWLQTDIQSPTTVRGRCLSFKYSIDGLNVEALRVIRVDILDILPNPVGELSQQKKALDWNFINTDEDVAAAVSTVMETAFGSGSGKVHVSCLPQSSSIKNETV